MASDAGKIEKYLNYAEELRGFAERMNNPEAKRLVLSVADDYERLAKMIEKQTATT